MQPGYIDSPAWVEVDLAAIDHNVRQIRQKIPDNVKFMAIIKANAYGLGAVPVAVTALAAGADHLGVAVLAEGVALRDAGVAAPIMVLGYLHPDQVEEAINYNIDQTVYTLAMARRISQVAQKKQKTAAVQIKIDSGMGRLGFLPDEAAADDIAAIYRLPGLKVTGIFSHLAAAEEQDGLYAKKQLQIFDDFCHKLEQKGLVLPLRHIANTAAVLTMPEAACDMVRVGLGLYGYYPTPRLALGGVNLRPSVTVKVRISYIKQIAAGQSVGYGCSWVSARPSRIATLQIGYADGVSRRFGQAGGQVLIGGRAVPVCGNVCMDQMMVDISDLPSDDYQEAVLIGGQGDAYISLEEAAEKFGTINYEVLCRFGARLPRIYLPV